VPLALARARRAALRLRVARYVLHFWTMSRSLHVRLDDSSAAALNVIRSEGLTDSEAVRTALREAAGRRRARSSIAAEVRQLAADERDRAEMRAIREQMDELAPETL
jgi:antitoxin component of RelBE/YafQ-DinJ toxin-antitoxin module